MKNLYDENYYERGIETGISGYQNYHWMPDLTIPMCHFIIEYLNIKNETILDYGCAKGYLVKAMRLLGKNAYGYDVSEYALNCADSEIRKYISSDFPNKHYDLVISKDVFEHIPYENIDEVITKLRKICDKMFVVVPLGEYGKFNIPSYELDKTHIIRESLDWWENIFKKNGFCIKQSTYRIKGIKDNYSSYEKGNGFFYLI